MIRILQQHSITGHVRSIVHALGNSSYIEFDNLDTAMQYAKDKGELVVVVDEGTDLSDYNPANGIEPTTTNYLMLGAYALGVFLLIKMLRR